MITVFAGLVAVVAPILLALHLSNRQGKEFEQDRVLRYAIDVLKRSDRAADQVYAALNLLAGTAATNPCSESQISLMRQLDFSSSYIQSVGYVSGNRVVCSSLGTGPGVQFELGAPDVVTSTGSTVWSSARMPFAPTREFTVIARNGYAAIINKELPIDVSSDDGDLAVATITPDNRQFRSKRGEIDIAWIDRLQGKREVTFIDGNYVVAVARSLDYATVAVAALPKLRMQAKVRETAMWLVPTGLVAGAILVWAVIYVVRLQSAMPSVLRAALRRNEFSLMYQPVVDLRTRKLVGAEALIRWRRPTGEMVPPDIFIRVAEENGLIQRITERVINLLARDAWDFFRRHPNLHLGINLSAADLQSTRTVELLGGLARAIRARAGNLFVEVTERGIMNADVGRENLRTMRTNGIRVAIDDFGTGYSSLSYLETFELDYLKIDKSFVDKIGTEAATSQVVTHIIRMARDLKLQMIAEGVETEAQAKFLAQHGVQFAQGWLFGKPKEFSELEALLTAQDRVAASAESLKDYA